MNTTTKVAAAGAIGAVAVSAWLLFSTSDIAVSPDLAQTIEEISYEDIPSMGIGSLTIASEAIGSTSIESESIASTELRQETSLVAGSIAATELRPPARMNHLASLLWRQEMQKDSPDETALAKYRVMFGVQREKTEGRASAPAPFFVASLYHGKTGYDLSRLPFPVIDVDLEYRARSRFDFAVWAQRIYAERPSQIVIGWESLNNFDQQDVTLYADYMRQIRAVVRMTREVSPTTFIWITACYGTPTYKPWIDQMGKLGDGVALWNVAYFGAVPQFATIRRQVQKDAGGRPVMLLGFFGYKSFVAGSRKPPDFVERMSAAEVAARRAGFGGFVKVEDDR